MAINFKALFERRSVHLWQTVKEPPTYDFGETLEAVTGRWDRYRATGFDTLVSDADDMLEASAGSEHYHRVGETALRSISEAMILSGRASFETILDLPCGGGRVTRHLKAFFPESRLFVADVNTKKQAAVAQQFDATIFEFPHDFVAEPAQKFDLIFVGSLLTHFDRTLYERALDFFVKALAVGGIAVLTTHGRSDATFVYRSPGFAAFKDSQDRFRKHADSVGAKIKTNFDPDVAIAKQFAMGEFGYFAEPSQSAEYGRPYGGSFVPPSYVMQLVERRADCVVIGYKERAYGDVQDVLLLQKLAP